MQTIEVGAVTNDRTGDNLRAAATKANQNFTELYDALAFNAGGLAIVRVWAATVTYKVNQIVLTNGSLYRCLVDHGAGVFATDLAAGKWILLFTFPAGADGTNGTGYPATSASSFSIGTGSKAFATQSNLAYSIGARARITSAANTSNWMEGLVTGYATGVLTVNVTKVNGAGGPFIDWNINIAGEPGAGDLTSGNNLSDVASPKTAFDNLSVHGADVASAATLNLDAATGYLVDVTGTTGVTAVTLSDGRRRKVRFVAAVTITHGASLVCPGAANLVVGAGDYVEFTGYAAGVVRVSDVIRAGSGRPLNAGVAETLTKGYVVTEFDLGTITTGTVTPDPANGNFQKYTNNGAHTLAPPSATGSYTIIVDMTNAASAAIPTTSGFTKVEGDALTATNTQAFRLYILKSTLGTHLIVKRMA